MKKQSVLVLFGLLCIAVILGCSQSSENTFENPVAGISANVTPVPNSERVVAQAPAGKVRICHFIQADDLFDACGTVGNTVVIEVSANAFPKNHATHGDFTTSLPIGTCSCVL